MPTSVEREFNLHRIQRFIAKYTLNLDLVARMVFSLLPPIKTGLVLSMNRTNEKFGIFDVHILILDVTTRGFIQSLLQAFVQYVFLFHIFTYYCTRENLIFLST